MLFNSLLFLCIFLPLTLGAAVVAKRRAVAVLLVSSLVFYALAGSTWFLVPMLVTATFDFFVGRALPSLSVRSSRLLLGTSIVLTLSLLAWFKYSALIAQALAWLVSTFGAAPALVAALSSVSPLLPAGISFYTFQTISYVVDIHRQRGGVERSYSHYLTFVAFFPHLVAGPLTRHTQLLPQLHEISVRGIRPQWRDGILLFALGLTKKVVLADRVADLCEPYILTAGAQGFIGGWLAAIGYSLQIYFDFSGYSDMAIGLGLLFSVRLPWNFDSPYQARSPSEFWRRWHITLSEWLRDYLYIPLGGGRGPTWRVRMNLLVTMALGGLWHGAHATFLVWGLFHGALLVLHKRFEEPWGRMPAWTQRAVTYALVCVGWVFFRAETVDDALAWLVGMTGARGLGAVDHDVLVLGGVCAIGLAITMGLPNTRSFDFSTWSRARCAALGLATAAAIMLLNASSRFLYFQF